MKILLFGATGTAGRGILQACLQSADVTEVRVVARRPLGLAHDKLKVFLHDDYLDYAKVRDAFTGIDACLYAQVGCASRRFSSEL